MKALNLKSQAGFNLPEMLVATIIAGILGMLAYSVFGNSSSGVRAKTLYDAAQKITTSWTTIVQQTGVPVSVASTPLVAAGNTALDAVMVGNNPAGLILSNYATTMSLIGIKPMSNMAVITTTPAVGTAGAYTIDGFPVTLTSSVVNGQRLLNVVFASVPADVVQAIYTSHANVAGTPFDSTTAVSSGHVQYTAAATDGTMTLTLQFNP